MVVAGRPRLPGGRGLRQGGGDERNANGGQRCRTSCRGESRLQERAALGRQPSAEIEQMLLICSAVWIVTHAHRSLPPNRWQRSARTRPKSHPRQRINESLSPLICSRRQHRTESDRASRCWNVFAGRTKEMWRQKPLRLFWNCQKVQ